MRKPSNDPNQLKNKILIAIYVFRSLPSQYIETITSYDQATKDKARLVIVNLIQDKVLKKSFADNGSVYLRLTNKGYKHVTNNVLPQKEKPLYTFRRDRGVNHVISDHHYYNFVYVWDWIGNNPAALSNNIQIYDDSNINNCVIPFSYDSKKIVISPDILIFQPDEENSSFKKAVLVENDAGGETYRRLFDKFVEYSVLLDAGLKQNAITEAKIHFVFHSQTRAEQMLFGEKGILQFFGYANSTRKLKRIPIDTIIKTYVKTGISYAVYNKDNLQQPLSFIQYPLVKLLLERRPEWKIYT